MRLSLAVAAIAAVALVGCGNDDSAETVAPPPTPEPTVLSGSNPAATMSAAATECADAQQAMELSDATSIAATYETCAMAWAGVPDTGIDDIDAGIEALAEAQAAVASVASQMTTDAEAFVDLEPALVEANDASRALEAIVEQY